MKVVYEDNHIIIVYKESGEIVQGDKTGDKPLSDIVKEYIKEKYQKPGNVFLGVAHRLDRPVSGLVVFARTSKALTRLNKMFANGEVHKTYWAIVERSATQPLPVNEGLEERTLIHWLVRNEKQNKSYAYDHEVKNSKKAVLRYKVLSHGDRYDLVEVNLPPSDTLPVGSHRQSDQGRPEVWCSPQQPRRQHLPVVAPCRVCPSRIKGVRQHRLAIAKGWTMADATGQGGKA